MPELLRPKEIGDADFAWTRKYGTVMCIMGPFGVSASCIITMWAGVLLNVCCIVEGSVIHFRSQGSTFLIPYSQLLKAQYRRCNTF